MLSRFCPRERSESSSRDASPVRVPSKPALVGVLVRDRPLTNRCQWSKRKGCTAQWRVRALEKFSDQRGLVKIEYAECYLCAKHAGYLRRRGQLAEETKRSDLNVSIEESSAESSLSTDNNSPPPAAAKREPSSGSHSDTAQPPLAGQPVPVMPNFAQQQ